MMNTETHNTAHPTHPTHPNDSQTAFAHEDDAIDLRVLLGRLWRHRKMIVLGSILIVILAAAINKWIAPYQSQAFFQVKKLTPSNYKNYEPQVLNPERFDHYVKDAGVQDQSAIEAVRYLLGDPARFKSVANLVYPLTTKDAKELVMGKGVDDPNIDYLGLSLAANGDTPERARNTVTLLAEYFRDSVIYRDLSSWIDSSHGKAMVGTTKLEDRVIQLELQIRQVKRKRDNMKQVLVQYPDAARMEVRQLLSAEKGSERYMSPLAQIVALESELSELDIELTDLARDKVQNKLAREYFTRAQQDLVTIHTGQRLLAVLTTLQQEMFKGRNLNDEAIRDVHNNISRQVATVDRYYTDYRFVSGPSLPERTKGKSTLLVAALAGVAGFFLLVIGVLLVDWLRENEAMIAPDGSLHLGSTLDHLTDSASAIMHGQGGKDSGAPSPPG